MTPTRSIARAFEGAHTGCFPREATHTGCFPRGATHTGTLESSGHDIPKEAAR
jgi:hypothetical protein